MFMNKLLTAISSADYKPTVYLTKAVQEMMKTTVATTMGKFKDGNINFENLTEEKAGNLTIRRTDVHEEQMYAFVELGDAVVFMFGRKGLSNHAPAKTSLNGVEVFCNEQWFKFCCATWHYHLRLEALQKGQAGTEEEARETGKAFPGETTETVTTEFITAFKAILTAANPRAACLATRAKAPGKDGLSFYDWKKWDAKDGSIAMRASIMHIMKECEDAFARYAKVAKYIGNRRFHIIESNDDKLWGINKFTHVALDELRGLNLGKDADLIAEVKTLFEGPAATNKLGYALDDVMEALIEMEKETGSMSHENYVKAVKDFQLVTMEKQEVDNTDEAMASEETDEARALSARSHSDPEREPKCSRLETGRSLSRTLSDA